MRYVRMYLFTLQPTDFQGGRLAIRLPLSAMRGRPGFGQLGAGSPLELVRADGSRRRAWVIDLSTDEYSVYDRGDDGTLYEIRCDPLFRLQVAPRLTDWDAPPGTEIWLLADPPAETAA
jgi:hypothetical protein